MYPVLTSMTKGYTPTNQSVCIPIIILILCSCFCSSSVYAHTFIQKTDRILAFRQSHVVDTIYLKIGHKSLPTPIKYFISGGRLNNITAEKDNVTLSLLISSTSNGTLTIQLPRNVIDSKIKGSNSDAPYQVFENGVTMNKTFTEIRTTEEVRTLSIQLDGNTKRIEIAGTQIMPFFPNLPNYSYIYSPQVSFAAQSLINSTPSLSPVKVIGKVHDRFGNKDSAILYYSVGCLSILCKDIDWHTVSMNLIWGTPSDGTFAGVIPAIQKGSTVVNYYVKFTDDLGYTTDEFTNATYFVTSDDDFNPPAFNPPYWHSHYFPISNKSAAIVAWITDDGTGVKNVTFIDGITQKQMKLIDGNKWDGLYSVLVPVIRTTNSIGNVLAYDYTGHTARDKIIQSKSGELNASPIIHGDVSIAIGAEPDTHNLTAKSRFLVNGQYPIRDTPDETNDSIKVINTESNHTNYKNYFEIAFTIKPQTVVRHVTAHNQIGEYRSHYVDFKSVNTANQSLALLGEPIRFPFDKYYLNLVLAIPFRNVTIQDISGSFSSGVNSSWIPSVTYSLVDPHNIGIQSNFSTINPKSERYIFPWASAINDTASGRTASNFTFVNTHIGFQRNNTIAAITIPLFAIFYLLGAIFVLGRTFEQLAIRVAITLSIFAFLFTFTPIINSMKPLTLNNIPTIADFLVTIIIVATIVFTVSSVVGSVISISIKDTEVLKQRYSPLISWIDRIAFLIIAVTLIYYGSSYPLDITVWLLPVVLFGLCYGLLLRVFVPHLFEVKINYQKEEEEKKA